MLTRTYVNSRYWFYPIGNTPAVNLLRDVLVQEGGPVNILSLGCGDVRNILFTLWSQGPIKPNVTINVTACDIDPAILARNVFLLSFLVKCSAAHGASGPGDEILDTLWSIYYHFFLTAKSTSALQIHALELVELSVSADRWASSLYGQVFSFLGLVKRSVATDWDECITSLVEQIEQDRTLLIRSNSLRELYTHLHISQLWNVDMLAHDPRNMMTEFGLTRSGVGEAGLLGRKVVPGIVHVVLVVPRSKLDIFTKDSLDRVGTPPLHLSIYNEPRFENSFFAIDASFGKLETTPGYEDPQIVEDVSGWKGRSDLIVTCAVPTFPFLVGSRNATRIALVVDTSPATIFFAQKLGLTNRVFDAGLDEIENAMLLAEAPVARVPQQKLPQTSGTSGTRLASPSDSMSDHVSLSITGKTLDLSLRRDFTDPLQRQNLLNNGIVNVSQVSPCTMVISIDDASCAVSFPYPVDGSTCRTRIARKQSWIEIIARPSHALIKGGYALIPMPVVLGDRGSPSPWTIGRVNIDRQPIIADEADKSFILSHFGMCLGLAEFEASQNCHKFKEPEYLP